METAIKAVFSLSIIVLILRNIRVEEVLQMWAGFPASSFVAIAPIFLMDRFVMSWKWTFLLRPLAVPLSRRDAFKIYYLSSFLGYLIPLAIGPDVVRYFRTKNMGYEGGRILVSISVERLLGAVANILILIIGIILLLCLAFRIEQLRNIVLVTMILAGGSVLVLMVLFSEKGWSYLARHPFGGSRHVRTIYGEFEAGLALLRKHPRALVFFTVASVAENFLPVTVTYLMAQTVHLPLTLVDCVAFVPICLFLQKLPFSFMGLGIREGSYAVFLKFFGISAGKAVGLGTLVFAVQIIVLLPAALLLLFDQFPWKAEARHVTSERGKQTG